MIFYKAKAEDGRVVLAGTQADARAINKQFEQVDIPIDKAGLMAFAQRWADEEFHLNTVIDMQSAEIVRLTAGEPDGSGAAEEGSTPSLPQLQLTNDTLDRISVEEEIHNCDLPRLAVLAQCVAWRFQELGK
ncbi:hypothetical protein KNJ79_05095 [Sphingopyxis indica]|uniref:hypothetical protein n=1 Tax=Sphingopyxis indica TaxID=436663 RepID=UPI00293912BE|nr:hypothetical protein [Sphingopyxis indica]WOF44308.1 hypothetical protein KNJ79_05095 [Sphingopyxis indica]